MKIRGYYGLLGLIFSGLIFTAADGEVRLPAIIGDNMVLQTGPQAAIWGWADPGEKVAVRGGWGDPGKEQVWKTTADEKGKWIVRIDTPHTHGPYTITVSGKNTIKINNVLIGEVWVCSGQSNMEWVVQNSDNAEQEIAAANYPQIRLFKVEKKVADDPQEDCKGQWVICSPETVPPFSAVAYFFGRELYQKLGVPVGLINTSWGGTPAEAWTKMEILKSDPDYQPILERFKQAVATYPQAMKKYEEAVAKWKEEVKKAQAEKKPVPHRPWEPLGPGHSHSPAGLYNGMIAPLIPFSIRGAIWYQGESNVGRAYQYRKLFPAMIRNWRDDWGQGDFTFLFVQIAPWRMYSDNGSFSELQESQLLTLKSVKNTGMVVTTDIGNLDDIHPHNKQDVGKRLALWALSVAYGKAGVYSGPIYKSMQGEGNKIRLYFDHAVDGLVNRGGPLTFFTIAGEDKNFVRAQAVIDGKTVVVSSEQVPHPVAVRFAWTKDAEPNLFNKDGLPASPFRTDDWPGVTSGKN